MRIIIIGGCVRMNAVQAGELKPGGVDISKPKNRKS